MIKISTTVTTHIINSNIDFNINNKGYRLYVNDGSEEQVFEYFNSNLIKSVKKVVVDNCSQLSTTSPYLHEKSKAKYIECSDPFGLYSKISENPDRVLYYTGAGISRDSGILTMPELERKLRITTPVELLSLLEYNPEFPLLVINDFYESIKKARPNSNHYLLKNVIKSFGGDLVTENVDILHELSGILPVKPYKGQKLQRYDYNTVVILGACTLQCTQLISKLYENSKDVNLISYSPLLYNRIEYNYYNMDIYDFLLGLNTYLNN